jgi:AcrR family transcriptional regulator
MSPRPNSLSSQQIAHAALALADAEGLDAVTMQRVASALGVGTMTLYGYFRSKEELLDAVVDAVVEDIEPQVGDGPWREQLHALAQLAHETLARHPALVALRFRAPVLRPEALRFGEAALAIMTRAGFSTAEATRAFRLLFTFVVGFAGLSPHEDLAAARRQASAAIAHLDPAEFPHLTEAAAEASWTMGGEEQFAYGIDRILDGLEARVGEQHATPDVQG